MADVSSTIFNKKAAEKLRSPDDLDKYVRVTNPSVWVVLAACVALLAGLLAWGVFGAVTTSVSATGAVIDVSEAVKADGAAGAKAGGENVAMCFLSAGDVANVSVGDEANVGGVPMTVSYVSPIPATPDDWDEALQSRYLVQSLFSGDWAYPVAFEGDASQLDEGVPVSVVITTDRVAPITLILKNWG